LSLDDEALQRQCRFEPYKSGGPGGQKRNKTTSAAQMTHLPTGLIAHSGDFRRQSENRLRALHRLRFKLAATLRSRVELIHYRPPLWLLKYRQGDKLLVNAHNPDLARVAAHLLDVLEACSGNDARAAANVGVSTSSFVKLLKQEPTLWRAARSIREQFHKPAEPFGG
jgi:hypothetical protein